MISNKKLTTHFSCANFILVSIIVSIIISTQMKLVSSSVIVDKISKRAAFFGDEPSGSNSLTKTGNSEGCSDTDVTISRPCSYEECVESKYPYHGVCRKWQETEWSEKVKICMVVVDPPCKK